MLNACKNYIANLSYNHYHLKYSTALLSLRTLLFIRMTVYNDAKDEMK